ncbi:MAG TPA: glycosyltransferase family 39 protein [Gemmatimonadaceae bacterium]|nr:glycosyltransferase family 39 protein [Gemmatimonadaceae bacterium]
MTELLPASTSVDRRTRITWLAIITLVAFALRVLATARFEGMSSPPNPGAFYDGVEFERIAANLINHGEFSVRAGHPTSFRAPGLPFALAFVYGVAGVGDFFAAHIFFCLIGALTCVAGYVVARECGGDLVGLITAGAIAVYPNLLYYCIHFASEPLFTLLLTLSVWAFLRSLRRDDWRMYATSGVLLGLASLTRPAAFYFLPFFGLAALVVVASRWRPRLIGIVAFGLGAIAPVIPWAARNYAVHGKPLLFASNGGSTFWGSNNEIVLNDPQNRGGWVSTEDMPTQKALVKALPGELERDALEWQFGKEFLREHPRDIPRLVWYKLYALWTPVSATPNALFNRIQLISYGIALPFMLMGVVLLVGRLGLRDPRVVTLSAPILATTAASLVFYGSARFRSTIDPLLLTLVAVALLYAWERGRAAQARSAGR